MNRFRLMVFSLSLLSCGIDRTIVEISESESRILSRFQELPLQLIHGLLNNWVTLFRLSKEKYNL